MVPLSEPQPEPGSPESVLEMDVSGGMSVLEFLKIFRPIECSCCDAILGFQNRTTAQFFCADGQAGRQGKGPCHMKALQSNGATNVKKSSIGADIKEPTEERVPVTPMYHSKVAEVSLNETIKKGICPELVSVAEPDVLTWTKCIYSPNLKDQAPVHVVFHYSPKILHLTADIDEAQIEEMQLYIADYVKKVKHVTKPPIVGQIVIGKYEDQYYRGRVDVIPGEGTCQVAFVDYGDKKLCSLSDVFPIDETLAKKPIYGMVVHLDKVNPPEKFDLPADLEGLIYGGSILDLVPCKEKIIPTDPKKEVALNVRLWTATPDRTLLNESLNIAIKAAESGWTPLTSSEKKELDDMCSTNPLFKETKKRVEDVMFEYSLTEGKEEYRYYVYKLDNADYIYRIQEMPLMRHSLIDSEMEFKITKFKSLAEVIAKPTFEEFENIEAKLHKKVESWMNARSEKELEEIKPKFLLHTNEMCIVRWPKEYETVCGRMTDIFGESWWHQNNEDLELNLFSEDYEAFSGKWFRAACIRAYDVCKRTGFPTLYEVFMIDLGITTMVLCEDVYKIPHRLVFDFQLSMYLSVKLGCTGGVTQYSKDTNEKWKYLLLPGMTLKVKILWMFDEIKMVKLIDPSESDLETHFRHPSVVAAIENLETKAKGTRRYWKVKKKSVIKGSFPLNMEIALAEEAAENEFQKSRKEYFRIGRTHPENVFELSIPNQIPEKYRKILVE